MFDDTLWHDLFWVLGSILAAIALATGEFFLLRWLVNRPCCHEWTGQQMGGAPDDAGSLEWVEYCRHCGEERQED